MMLRLAILAMMFLYPGAHLHYRPRDMRINQLMARVKNISILSNMQDIKYILSEILRILKEDSESQDTTVKEKI